MKGPEQGRESHHSPEQFCSGISHPASVSHIFMLTEQIIIIIRLYKQFKYFPKLKIIWLVQVDKAPTPSHPLIRGS